MATPRLGIDSFSIRAFRWKALPLIDYAASVGAGALQLSIQDQVESGDAAYLARVKQAAAEKDIYLDAAGGCFGLYAAQWNKAHGTPAEYLQKSLKLAQGFGATVLRCYIGSPGDRRGRVSMDQHLEAAYDAVRAAKTVSEATGVKIALENHGEITARELRSFIEDVGKSYVGCTLDTGNPMWVLEDPLLTAEVLAPLALTTHLRDSVLFEHPRGAAFQWVALGEGSVPLGPVLQKIFALAPAGCPALMETITGRPPQVLPYHEESFWRSFPRLPAADFARFVALAKQGRPFEGQMIIADAPQPPAEFAEALKLQQRLDLEKSLRHGRELLRKL